ncbi:TIGR02757 family protein [Rhodothermus profundi]|uniref:TIGR02757 family protein n=1 Tax=Rhodothermus profundi TaxID=633813 RepID=A0A1M6TGY1_9BACT|nr:TIGR02757 family protein [Rhodothermus profundi]SHK56096.1 TIGR02757 family protein [Rhodothermus profundi]
MMEIDRQMLDALVSRYEQPDFIATDPIAIPHAFDDPRDQEVIGLYAALLAWGRRSLILRKLEELCARMDYRPYHFVRFFAPERDADRLRTFRHRTFQPEDAFWLTRNLQVLLTRYETIERFVAAHLSSDAPDIGPAIEALSRALCLLPETPQRLRKHLPRPSAGSACKRLALYFRWMVRSGPVDLGLWQTVRPAQLVIPLDVHVGRQARAWGLLRRNANDWKAVQELTAICRQLCPEDPVRYDFALFGAALLNSNEGTSVSPTAR